MVHQFLDTVNEYGLLKKNYRVLVGISGGADSVCLLDLLRLVAPKFNLHLQGIHINHQIRANAERDESFVRKLSQSWGIGLTVVTVDAIDYARRHKLGLEEGARYLRYHHYRRVARIMNCDVVALGHTADDNLETVIYNLVRGSGRRGIGGIPVSREIFIRPLLKVTRQAVRDYLRSRSVEWIEDESNEDTRFTRNLIRLQVVPLLEQINPSVRENVLRSCELLNAEDVFLDSLATQALNKISRVNANQILIDIPKFIRYNIVLKRRIIKLLVPEIDAAGIERILDLVTRGCQGRHQLKANVLIGINKNLMHISKTGRRLSVDAD